MRQVWTEENKFNAYLKVELLAAEAWSKLGVVPEEDVVKLNEKATFNIDRIKEIIEEKPYPKGEYPIPASIQEYLEKLEVGDDYHIKIHKTS